MILYSTILQTILWAKMPFFAALFNLSLSFNSNPPTSSENAILSEKPDKFIKDIQKEVYQIKTIVIDPGHGGHDPGCLGASNQEKNIALGIAKKLSALLQQNYPALNVILTRETDVFIPLYKRASIANKSDADLFISIHCNATPDKKTTALGTETYVMGLHTAKQNLEVAKRENASILLEDDYQQNYDYDPNSPEGHIIMSMFQNAFLDQSILLAQKIEDNLKFQAKRKSRGVKQAGFLVLKATAMPSVLIESGFLNNPTEENYLSTYDGQLAIADAIFNAFSDYKAATESGNIAPPIAKSPLTEKKVFAKTTVPVTTPPQYRETAKPRNHEPEISQPRKTIKAPILNINSSVQYHVQLVASPNPIKTDQVKWKNLGYLVEIVQEDSYYKYQARNFVSFEDASMAKEELSKKGFPDAFVVAYKNGKRISLDQAKGRK